MLAALVVTPLLATAACGSGGDSTHVSSSALGDATGAAAQPAPTHPPLDPARVHDVQTGLDAVNSDKVLGDANTALNADNARLRAAGTLAPPNAKRLNDLRVVRPKNCADIRSAAAQAAGVLGDGRGALSATSTDVQTVTSAVARLRPVLARVRSDITALQATVDYANANSRQQLQTYSTAADAADVNLTGSQASADEARTRVQKLTSTFDHLQSARDKALQGC